MEILEAYDLVGSYRGAARLAGCHHHTVKHYVERRDAEPWPLMARCWSVGGVTVAASSANISALDSDHQIIARGRIRPGARPRRSRWMPHWRG